MAKRMGYPETDPQGRPLCENARKGMAAWFCYHLHGTITPDTELAPGKTKCKACERVGSSAETLPSFMRPEGEL